MVLLEMATPMLNDPLGYELQRVGTDEHGQLAIRLRGDRPQASPRLLDRFRSGALDWAGARVRFGLVLSGDKLIDNMNFRDQLLLLEPEAIGGEMEGAGLYAAAERLKVDWIVVKAISDWADGKKREGERERQQLAAKNATAFVVQVLRQGGLTPPLESSGRQLPTKEDGQRPPQLPPDSFPG